MKKIFIILAIIVLLVAVYFAWFFYKKTDNSVPYGNNLEVKLTPEIIQDIGGQEEADKVLTKFEKAKQTLATAIKDYEASGKAEDKKPSVMLFTEASNQAYYLHQYDVAISFLQDVFKYYEKSEVALANLAHLYEAKGEYQNAIDTYLKVYKDYDIKFVFDPDIMQNYKNLGNKTKVAEYYADYKKAGYSSEEIEQYLQQP